MLKVKPFRQTKEVTCGPACLKTVLYYFGIYKTEKELVKLCETDAHGTRAENLLQAGKLLGLKGLIKKYADFEDIEYYVIKKKIPVIVDWFSGDDGHYSIVVDIDKKNIYLANPEFGRVQSMNLKRFKRVWFDFTGDFLRSKKDIILRRIIVLHK